MVVWVVLERAATNIPTHPTVAEPCTWEERWPVAALFTTKNGAERFIEENQGALYYNANLICRRWLILDGCYEIHHGPFKYEGVWNEREKMKKWEE